MFGRDMYIPPIAHLLQPKLRYLEDKSSLLSVEMLREAYMLAAINLKRVRDRQLMKRRKEIPKFKIGDLELLNKS